MKFTTIVGNPPYQDGNNQIYTLFYTNAIKMADRVELIFPTGWQGTSTANLLNNLNNEEVKRDKQIVVIDNKHNAFPGIPGAEWTNVILWSRGFDNGYSGKQRILTDGQDERIVLLPITKDDIAKPEEIESIVKKVNLLGEDKMIDRPVRYYGTNPDLYRLFRDGMIIFDNWYELTRFWDWLPYVE